MRAFARTSRAAVLAAPLAAAAAGCAPSEDRTATDTAAGTVAAASAPGRISLADVAGRWRVRAMRENGDTALATYEVVATDNIAGWTMHFPDRPPIPMRVTFGGDSIITQAGPYESVLRPGVRVIVHSVSRLRDGKLVGTFVAGYMTAAPDSVLRGRHEGTRIQ
jgi:hypothetical protein